MWATVLRQAGVGVVSLANNHVMDYGPSGLAQTMDALSGAGVRFAGAGLDRERACAPAFVTIRGTRVAFLARTGVLVTAPSYAQERSPGTAFLDPTETVAAIKRCRPNAEVVVLLLHWGLEEYRYPSPSQRKLVKQFARAGADVVLGHHPHVTQGIERIGRTVVAYSLGNFAFGETEWQWRDRDGSPVSARLQLSVLNRQGLLLELNHTSGLPIAIAVRASSIDLDGGVGFDVDAGRLEEVSRLSRALTARAYALRWWLYAMQREWVLRLRPANLSPFHVVRRLTKLRGRHLRQAAATMLRSSRIIFERSTNPYE
jgi:hypothetical protein